MSGNKRRHIPAVFRLAALLLAVGLTAAGCVRVPDGPDSEPSTAPTPSVSAPTTAAGPTVLPEGTVRLCALNVGKADCLLLTAGSHHILFDTGESQTAAQVSAWLTAQGVSRLELLVLTHNDKDHIGGAAQILRDLPVERIIQADYDEDSAAYTRYRDEAAACGLTPERLTAPLSLTAGGADLRLLPGERNDYEDDNDFSLITEVTVGSRSMLLTGDAEKERLREYLASAAPRRFDVVKLPHHGSWNGATKEFLTAFCGDNAIVSTSAEEKPAKKLRKWFEENERRLFCTYDGTVTVLTDGSTLSVTQ